MPDPRMVTQPAELWQRALDIEPAPGDALCLLADAIAFGCNTLDGDPTPFAERVGVSFDALHIAKHLGRPN